MARFKFKRGYKYFKNSGLSVARYVAGRKIGRPLKKTERVHHINRDKTDNRRCNLDVYKNQREHTKTHRKDKKNTGLW